MYAKIYLIAKYFILVDRIINVIHTLVKITSHLAQKESRTGRLKHIHVCLIVSDYIWKFCTELQTKTVKSDIPGHFCTELQTKTVESDIPGHFCTELQTKTVESDIPGHFCTELQTKTVESDIPGHFWIFHCSLVLVSRMIQFGN
jgi:hypothetical protein